MAMQNPAITKVRPNGLDDMPEYGLKVDQEKASALGLSLGDINRALEHHLGIDLCERFHRQRPREKGLRCKATRPSACCPRMSTAGTSETPSGGMTPFSAFSSAAMGLGLAELERFNGSPSASILGEPRRATVPARPWMRSTQMSKALPPGIGIEWAGLSYEERLAGSKSASLYTIAVMIVFLCLAALYESWAIPFSVLMDMPLGALGVVAPRPSIRGMPNDIYFQIGSDHDHWLSAKNAILVIEFAKERFDNGARPSSKRRFTPSRQRLRPILMTSHRLRPRRASARR